MNPSAMNRDLLSAMPDPEIRPAYSDLVIDSEGFIWAEESQGRTLKFTGGQPSRWTVFSPEGEWLGGVQLPYRFFVFEIGSDYVLGRRYDEEEVEHVELLRLTRRPHPKSLTISSSFSTAQTRPASISWSILRKSAQWTSRTSGTSTRSANSR